MPRGGRRPGAGRKKGNGRAERNARPALKALASGTTPLDYIVGVMRGELEYDAKKFEAAKAAAPYMHPRLAAIEHSGEIVSKHEKALDELEKLTLDGGVAAASTETDLDELENRVLN